MREFEIGACIAHRVSRVKGIVIDKYRRIGFRSQVMHIVSVHYKVGDQPGTHAIVYLMPTESVAWEPAA